MHNASPVPIRTRRGEGRSDEPAHRAARETAPAPRGPTLRRPAAGAAAGALTRARMLARAAAAETLTLAAIAAAMLIVTSTATSDTASLSVCPSGCPYTKIQAAVEAASSGDTITVDPGTYVEGSGRPGTSSLTIAKSLTIDGAGAGLVTIEPAPGTIGNNGSAGNSPARYDAAGNVVAISSPDPAKPISVSISGVTVNGEGARSTVDSGVAFTDATGSLTNSVVTNIDQYRTGIQAGIGVTVYSDQSYGAFPVSLGGDDINGYSKGGVYVDGTGQPAGSGVVATISHTTIAGAGLQAFQTQNGLFIGDGASAIVTQSVVSGNYYTGPGNSDGVILWGPNGLASTSITSSDIENNGVGIISVGRYGGPTAIPIHDDRFAGNLIAVDNYDPSVANRLDVTDDWWGCNGGPNAPRCQTTNPASGAAAPAFGSWLTLDATASADRAPARGSTTITASLTSTRPGAHAGAAPAPDGTPVSFSTNLGAIRSPVGMLGGRATGTLDAGSTPGTADVVASLDEQSVRVAPITVIAPTHAAARGPNRR